MAAQKANEYFRDLYSGTDLGIILLEEAEISEDKKYWLITLSCEAPRKSIRPSDVLAGLILRDREYKIFKIDATNGEVLSMKIRTLK